MILWYKNVVGKVELGQQTSQAVTSPSCPKSIEIIKKKKKRRREEKRKEKEKEFTTVLPNKEK